MLHKMIRQQKPAPKNPVQLYNEIALLISQCLEYPHLITSFDTRFDEDTDPNADGTSHPLTLTPLL